MIHKHIQTINEAFAELLPTRCGDAVWKVELNGLGKIVWSNENNGRYMHDQDKSYIVRNDYFDLQTCHTVDRIRKQKVQDGINVATYSVECSWYGIGTTLTGGLLAMSVFEQLEPDRISAMDFDNNTERILTQWGIDRETWGHNPEYNAWRISYYYTLPSLNRDELLILEGLNGLD